MFVTDRSSCLGPGTMFRKLIVFRRGWGYGYPDRHISCTGASYQL